MPCCGLCVNEWRAPPGGQWQQSEVRANRVCQQHWRVTQGNAVQCYGEPCTSAWPLCTWRALTNSRGWWEHGDEVMKTKVVNEPCWSISHQLQVLLILLNLPDRVRSGVVRATLLHSLAICSFFMCWVLVWESCLCYSSRFWCILYLGTLMFDKQVTALMLVIPDDELIRGLCVIVCCSSTVC